ncbi:MAG: protease inhibitor I42 family protein [Candidatus Nealsonbacteria bacterium]
MLKLIITVFISLLIVVGVSYGANHYIVAPATESTRDAGIQIIEKEVGEDFEIVLEANLTTGYQWTIEFDQNYLQLIEKNYVPDFQENTRMSMSLEKGRIQSPGASDGARDIIDSNQAQEQLVQNQIDEGVVGIEGSEESEIEVPFGVGGQEFFKFLTLKKGDVEIRFSYERSWVGEPIKILTYKVIIK